MILCLQSIPAGGMTMWLNLSKKSKLKRQGVLMARFNFSSEKNSQVAAQEHRHLLRILLLHELESSKVSPLLNNIFYLLYVSLYAYI